MPVGNHVAEIVRQGILASLTGGFCYEPANTMFCNTVHMYIWSILLILPLLLGLFVGGTLTWGPFVAYGCFMFLLFLILKAGVTYLHQVFDKTEPMVAFKSKKAETTETFRSPVSSFSTTRRETTSNIDGGQMIELNELNSNMTRASCKNPDDDNDVDLIPSLLQPIRSSSNDEQSNSSQYSAASGDSSANELLSLSKASRTVCPTESLDRIFTNFQELPDSEMGRRVAQRKHSFPSLEDSTYNCRPTERLKKMRKVRSTSDTTRSSQQFAPMPHSNLAHSHLLLLNQLVRTSSRNEYLKPSDEPSISKSKTDPKKGADLSQSWKSSFTDEKEMDKQDQPCCSKFLDQPSDKRDESLQRQTVKRSAQKLPTGTLRRTLDHLGAENLPELESCGVADLKKHITKFLEELIEKHPETLDAIENIRMNRLGRPSVLNTSSGYSNGESSGSRNDDGREPLDYYINMPLSAEIRDLSLQDGTHVAYDHEDTTQGAIHSFQDEKGNWWTYAFDEQGSGTARALGSSRAIAEMFDRRRSLVSNSSESRSSQAVVTAVSADVHAAKNRPKPRAWHGRRLNRNRSFENHSKLSDNTYGKNQKSLPTVPSNSLLDSQSLEHQSLSGNVSSNEGDENPSFSSQLKMDIEDDSDSDKYILSTPTNVFYPGRLAIQNSSDAVQTESLRHAETNETGSSRPFISFVNLASRLYSNQLQRNAGRNRLPAPLNGDYSRDFQPSASLIDASLQSMSRQSRMAMEAFALESRRRIQQNPDSERLRWLEYIRLESTGMLANSGVRLARSNPMSYTSNFMDDLQLFVQPRHRPVRQPQSKVHYYYRLKLLPKWMPYSTSRGIKIKLNRLSLTALFDRNSSWISMIFDILLALLVTVVTIALISRGIFNDFSLFVFAFVVAGSQFSLLKSVQPDAASPVHGFNWLVCYSRPTYFCLLALVTLFFDYKLSNMKSVYASPTTLTKIGFIPHRDQVATVENLIVSLRDLSALSILLLPVFFTVGLLPQINTLLMHLFEQVEMHVFGGTATFSLISSVIALGRSTLVVGLLCAFANFAYYMNSNLTQNVIFSTFVAVLLSSAFVMSRWSSNPMFLQVFLTELLPWWRRNKSCTLKRLAVSVAQQTETKANEPRVSYRKKANEAGSNVILELGTVTSSKKSPSTDDKKKNEPARNVNEMMTGGKVTDPLPRMLRDTLSLRVQHDLFYVIINTLLLFALHSTSLFTVFQPYFELTCFTLCFVFGSINHYVYPQLRAHNPWKLFAKPILRPFEFNQFETTVQAKLMTFERIHIWMLIIEKAIFYPLLIVNMLTNYAWMMPFAKIPLTVLFAFRLARSAYANSQMLFVPLGATFCICYIGLKELPNKASSSTPVYPFSYFGLDNPSPLFVFYCLTLIWPKIQEFILKMNFILIYLAPWQISWGSAFHAFAQPFSVPHTGLVAAQAMLSSLISAPLNPFLGSSFFLMSYVRPLRFWEKNYNTTRVDHNSMRLVSQIDKGPMIDDSSLNSIFYEHLTRSLQQSLAGDLALGRWGCSVEPGDCFILVSLYLSCMIHVVELGNGFVTFQMRGLEFRGTYCHQREAEAISEDWTDGGGCCCCSLGPIPGLLSFNNNWALRSQAWTVTTSKYIIDGYSITDNSAVNLLQVHELRRLLVTFYVKCIIFYALKSASLESWLSNEIILQALEPIRKNPRYADNDQMFCTANDEDYDPRLMALSRQRFFDHYCPWVSYCLSQRLGSQATADDLLSTHSNTLINSFCFALSVLGRRSLGAATNGNSGSGNFNRSNANAAESFLYGLHALFKGDMRVGSPLDEWVFADPGILTDVISPAVRMALKLHQDHFAVVDDFEELENLYERIQRYQTSIFISHEHDPAWRQAIITNTPSLLALRHIYDESQDDYKVIMLNKMHLNMRVIKLNRECVRAFWAGQQQELIFLRNRNPERGSIQNARQVLRNMINSSADQPIGYPIYVSPLTTSFVETHDQVESITGKPITLYSILNTTLTRARSFVSQLRQHFGTSNSSNMAVINTTENPMPVPHHQIGPTISQAGATPLPTPRRAITLSGHSLVAHPFVDNLCHSTKEDDNVSHAGSLIASLAAEKNTAAEMHRRCKSDVGTSTLLKKGLADRTEQELSATIRPKTSKVIVEIKDVDKIQSRLNEPLKFTAEFLVVWPDDNWRLLGGPSHWPPNFKPAVGMRGEVVHHWQPFHPKREFRSHSGSILLVAIQHESYHVYIPILKEGVRFVKERYNTETNL